ncbi:MAG: hypothetical protein NFW16_11900 [Candidatus Accumulibacter sp.]|uniref:DUF6794 domain-containing protein n=1 Tax=Accumulibacter sp. TaxID=2053492 RepID=UPI00258BFF7B|nr:DUF6794 domain-containing protein [Accumulibacter sp.]MCM8622408.1 hypothetical protein [Accumulibacter sp.]
MSADALARDRRIGRHRGLDGWIRNNLGLWKGNASLLEATGAPNADDVPLVIIEAVRRRLQGDVSKVH